MERYEFNWLGKKNSALNALKHIDKTLRAAIDESVDFDNTKNLFIEGDNLEALKLLQETYLGKVKMIYIDPPYNTGKDFIYRDNFTQNTADYLLESNQKDEEGNRFIANTESNGRFHSDWLSFIYPRLKLARNLLADDGVIFISIDDNEQANLKKLCDEVFGEENFVMSFVRKTVSNRAMAKFFNTQHEFVLCIAKNIINVELIGKSKDLTVYQNPDNDPNGAWISANPSRVGGYVYEVVNPYTGKIDIPPKGRGWNFKKTQINELVEKKILLFRKSHKKTERGFIIKAYLKDLNSETSLVNSLDTCENSFMNQVATKELIELMGDKYFDFPKPINLLKYLFKISTSHNDLILDFFAGSSTTAHAVMQLNAKDGGNRQFIMVQLPEKCDEKSESYKAGYKNIAEISKERIRRAGKKILEGECHEGWNKDIGFRVLKIENNN